MVMEVMETKRALPRAPPSLRNPDIGGYLYPTAFCWARGLRFRH